MRSRATPPSMLAQGVLFTLLFAVIGPERACAVDASGFEGGYPSPQASIRARDDADIARAVTAYRFWYPTVSVEGIFNGNRVAGIEDNRAMGIAAAGLKQVGFTLNSDTPYGSAALDLSRGPMVVELPPGPYSASSTTITSRMLTFHQEGLVVRAVGREPVSARRFPVHAENTGKRSGKWMVERGRSEIIKTHQLFGRPFPTRVTREEK